MMRDSVFRLVSTDGFGQVRVTFYTIFMARTRKLRDEPAHIGRVTTEPTATTTKMDSDDEENGELLVLFFV